MDCTSSSRLSSQSFDKFIIHKTTPSAILSLGKQDERRAVPHRLSQCPRKIGEGILARIPGASVPAVTRVHELHGWPLRQNLACAITLHRFIVVATLRQRPGGKDTGVIILLACFSPRVPVSASTDNTRAHPHARASRTPTRPNKIPQHPERQKLQKMQLCARRLPRCWSRGVKYIKATSAINIGLFTDSGPRMPGINSTKCPFN